MQRIYDVISPVFRRRRMRRFVDQFGVTDDTRILDVGGTTHNWRLIATQPQVTMLNLYPIRRRTLPAHITEVQGDGCAMPYPDREFDVVYSNSVIEHLGTWDRQQAFAREVRRTGSAYYVQTPNRHFPIEPHYLAPFVHWLPRSWQARVLRWGTPWGWITRPTPERVANMTAEIRLLSAAETQALFPDATIERERVLGLTKSLIAVRARNS